MSKGKFAIGALIGVAAGFIAGIVTAPKSGIETRSDLKAKANEIKDDVLKKTEKVTAEAQETASDLKNKAEELKTRTERAVEGAKKGFFGTDKK